jgi:hypothetical protein
VVNIVREDITEQSLVKEFLVKQFFTAKSKPYKSYNHVSKTGNTEKKKQICGHGDVKQVM